MAMTQGEVTITRGIYNLHRLSDHFIYVFRKIYGDRPVCEPLPRMTDLRCQLMADHLVNWEILAIYAPEKLRIDLFDLLCTRGGGFLNVLFLQFDGQLYFKGIFSTNKAAIAATAPYNQTVHRALVRLKFWYRAWGDLERQKYKADVKATFFEFWQDIVPFPFSKDSVLAQRISDLLKFKRLTYRIASSEHPFLVMDRQSALPGLKRSCQK